MNESISDGGDSRTALATPGLLNMFNGHWWHAKLCVLVIDGD